MRILAFPGGPCPGPRQGGRKMLSGWKLALALVGAAVVGVVGTLTVQRIREPKAADKKG